MSGAGEFCIRDGHGFCLIANGCGIMDAREKCRVTSRAEAEKVYVRLCDQAAAEGRQR